MGVIESILAGTSFSVLDDDGQAAVRQLYQAYNNGKPFNIEPLPLFRQRGSLTVLLDRVGPELDNTNPAIFKFLNSYQRKALKRELLFAFYVLSAQYQLDESEHRRQGLQARSEQIKKCAKLIYILRHTPRLGEKEPLGYSLEKAIFDSEKHAKYLGLKFVGPFIAEKMVELSSETTPRAKEWRRAGKTGVIKDWMGEINGRRLYWVWGGGLLRTVIGMLPNDFTNKSQAQKALSVPMPLTGYMSWILYYTRFGINLSLLLKHTIAGPWMSEKERQIPAWERFQTQWQQRKFALLNDSIWATANLACFFWLTGRGLAGYFGDVATVGLLLMDTCLTVWRFYEESTAHNQDMARYNNDIQLLDKKIKSSDKKNLALEIERDKLVEARELCDINWKYKKYGLINDLVYATSLMLAFSLMCCFFFPPLAMIPATAIILGVTGAALSFVLTLAYTAVTNGIDLAKTEQSRQSSKRQCETLLCRFKELKAESGADENGFVKKQLYLEMQRLKADSDYQERLVNYKRLQLVRAILNDVLLPPLIFVSFMFLPLGIGLGVLAAGLVLVLLAKFILDKFAPKAAALPKMDEASYKAFVDLPDPTFMDIKIDDPREQQKTSGFFPKTDKTKVSDKPSKSDLFPDKGLDYA